MDTSQILSERSQTPEVTYYIIPFRLHPGEGKTIGMKNRSVVPGVGSGSEGQEDTLTTKGQHKGVFGVMGLSQILIVVVVTRLYEFVKTQRTVYQKTEFYSIQIKKK